MKRSEKLLITFITLGLLVGACADFLDIAWGTGTWLGRFSITWAALALVFCILCLSLFFAFARIFWRDELSAKITNQLIYFRRNLKWERWPLAALIFIFPAWFLQFTPFGVVFQGLFLRLTLWSLELVLLAFLLARNDALLVNWNSFLFMLVITASLFSILASLTFVTDYPFSLGWSEGNRLWDYSILFGSGRYNFPRGQEIDVFLDIGRQIVGGLPFLFPGLTIKMERLWLGLISILPYLLLGFATFQSFFREKQSWLVAVLWAYLFLQQGPINATLVLYAVLVVWAWRNDLWFSISLVILATYAAYITRFTWVFAPVMWFMMLELFDGLTDSKKELRLDQRSRFLVSLLIFGIVGGLVTLGVGYYFKIGNADGIFSIFRLTLSVLSQQALLWYRLLPNKTYGSGILIGLLIAVLPLVLILLYQVRSGKWQINIWQKWVIILPLLAFLAVGLIVSTKIGGGGDLHNMDMFLIGVFLAAALACHQMGINWIQNTRFDPLWVRAAVVLLIAIPAVGPLQELRSYNFGDQTSWLMTLTDAPTERSLDMYPSAEAIRNSLSVIQTEAISARESGDVLFMDQRQLLTFGYVQDIPLIPQYDKKVLIEQALRSNMLYFNAFYKDLDEKQFALIITQPLTALQKGSEYQFGEENNAWVKWVANPLLCFYEVKRTLSDVNVQLLIPRQGKVNCAKAMP